jgi:hypothetical protein
MDEAIRRECFKEGKPVCGKGKRKATVALGMGLGDKQGVLHYMEAADEKLAWRVVSDHILETCTGLFSVSF